jgi:hypothetical protein
MIIHIYKDRAGLMQFRFKMRENFTADELLAVFARLTDKLFSAYKKIKDHGRN